MSPKISLKKERTQISLDNKISIIRAIEKGEKQISLANLFKISRSTVSSIWSNKDKILESYCNLPKNRLKILTTKHIDLDVQLLELFIIQRNKNVPLTGQILVEKVNALAKSNGFENFNFSVGWIDRFKKRHGIIFGTISGESKSVDMENVDNWRQNVWPKLKLGFEDKDIFNADETALYYKALPNKTLKFKNHNSFGEKSSKDRLTILIS